MIPGVSQSRQSPAGAAVRVRRWWTETTRPWTTAVPVVAVLALVPSLCGWLGRPLQAWRLTDKGRIGVPVWVWFGALTLVIAAGVVARRARDGLRGPIVIGGIVDSGGGEPNGTDGLVAIIRDRLARAGAEPRGVTPGGSLDGGSSLTFTASPVHGVSASAKVPFEGLLRPFQLRGWSVRGTVRNSPASGQVGITLVIEHVATKRIDLARTVWQDSAADAARWSAYHIAVWYQDRFFDSSNRTSPSWQLTPTSLKLYEDAEFYLSQRRFDEALEAASRGLGEDPANIPLRRLRGEAHERLGLFQSALEVYAAGLVMLHDVRNSWNYSDPEPTDSWPVRELPIRSDDVTGLVWRFVAVLSFADHWIDRWIADLSKYEATLRHQRDELTGRRRDGGYASRWSGRPAGSGAPESLGSVAFDRMRALVRPERDQEQADRFEQAKRLRGFFHHRYHQLMKREFPLLHAAWFAERHARELPFAFPDDEDPAAAAPRSPDAWLAAEQTRFPARIDTGEPGDPAYPAAASSGWAGAGGTTWLTEVSWFFERLQRGAAGRPGRPLTFAGALPADLSDVAAEVRVRLGLRPDQSLAGIGPALTDKKAWDDNGLDRVLLGEVVTWAARHVSSIAAGAGAPPLLDQDEQHRITLLRAQLDLRLFLQRVAIEEVDRLCREEEVIVGGFAPRHLIQMLWLSTRFRYLNRMFTLANAGDGQRAEDPGRMDPDHPRSRLRRETTETARASAERFRQRSRPRDADAPGDRQRWAEWTVYYYSACVHAIAMSEYRSSDEDTLGAVGAATWPGGDESALLDGPGRSGSQDRTAQGAWVRRFDDLAKLAVRGLNHALLVRRDGDVTPIKAGVLDWPLYEDPDLDQLRAHPRFQRWAASTFSLQQVGPRGSQLAQEAYERFRFLRRQQWDNEGVYSLERRWRRVQRLWWLANDLYLVESLIGVVPSVVLGWQRLAAEIDADPQRLPDQLARFTRRHAVDVDTWRRLASFERFAARPMLRLATARSLAQLGGAGRPQPRFPVTRDVLQAGVHLNYEQLTQEVVDLVESGATAAERLRRKGVATGSWRSTAAALRQESYAAATRWQTLLDVVVRQSGPSRR